MVGVRYAYALQQGGMRHGTGSATDQQIVTQGCGPSLKCTFTPKEMDMGMVMVDLMYAPTDWLTLMLMPQFMSMDMHLRRLDGSPDPGGGGHAAHGANPYHATGGVGDIFMGSLFKLYEAEGHKLHFTLGFTAPTGSVNQRVDGNTEFEHYGMQLGTGTWNIWPSLTYNGYAGDFNWGGQVSTNAPLQNHNDSGFAFGTLFQTTAWGGFRFKIGSQARCGRFIRFKTRFQETIQNPLCRVGLWTPLKAMAVNTLISVSVSMRRFPPGILRGIILASNGSSRPITITTGISSSGQGHFGPPGRFPFNKVRLCG